MTKAAAVFCDVCHLVEEAVGEAVLLRCALFLCVCVVLFYYFAVDYESVLVEYWFCCVDYPEFFLPGVADFFYATYEFLLVLLFVFSGF